MQKSKADESFRIEYSLTRGMEIEFYKRNNVVVRQQSADEYGVQHKSQKNTYGLLLN
ncbi:MAG: hypothetical protein ACRD8Z_26345 [Nitrososphaeraceae archaeon]